MFDLFGNQIDPAKAINVNIYADEIWEVENIYSKEKWIYSAAIYEIASKPILDDLMDSRYCKEKENWENYKDKNDIDIHWAEIYNNRNMKFIVERWLKYVYDDCFKDRRFQFSLMGINLTNLNTKEFDNKQNFNSIYNRFFRSMLKYSLKKFFGSGVVVDHIYHEEGSQQNHDYFDWHTIFKLDQDEKLKFNTEKIEFLPKSHKRDNRSNIIQLCDMLAGIIKDLHLGIIESNKNKNKREILCSPIVKNLIMDRIIRKPKNTNSSYGYVNRFHLSFFPKIRSDPGSINRSMDNYYDASKIELAFEYNPNQAHLF
jgi:hypothetical protein